MLRKLVQRFEFYEDLPIEIEEIRDAVVALGIQDRIILSEEDMDTGTIKGAYYQWKESVGVYAAPDLVSLIVYPASEPIEAQRVICAKELIHICDERTVRTTTPEMVEELATKVVGPFEGQSNGLGDVLAGVDKLAQYQGLELLFPRAARIAALSKLASGLTTIEAIARWAVIPEDLVRMMLDKRWDELSKHFISIVCDADLNA